MHSYQGQATLRVTWTRSGEKMVTQGKKKKKSGVVSAEEWGKWDRKTQEISSLFQNPNEACVHEIQRKTERETEAQ